MPASSGRPVVVLTVDQRGSRHTADLVPGTLAALRPIPVLRAFERTAGDEIQGVLDSPPAVADVIERLLREGTWNVGVGIAPVEHPLPRQARAGRGAAYLLARSAVVGAKSAPWHVRVVGADDYRCQQLETVVWLWAAVLGRRTERGWEVADLVEEGLSYEAVAGRLGISPSAVSQRARAGGLVEGARAKQLVGQLVGRLLAGGS